MKEIKTFVFLDLETTGLPHLEYNRTKITQICMSSVQSDHIEIGCFPRIQNKLNLFFNPQKKISITAYEITGLTNDMLENHPPFNKETVNIIKAFLDRHCKPICFVAHNGMKFDYPILRKHIIDSETDFPDDILCVDSLTIFKALDILEKEQEMSKMINKYEFDDAEDDFLNQAAEQIEKLLEEDTKCPSITIQQIQKRNETTPKKAIIPNSSISAMLTVKRTNLFTNNTQKMSYKLGDIFTRITFKEPIKAHEAEADVNMLITCTAAYAEKFVEYAKNNAKLFCEIPAMGQQNRF